MSETTQRDHLHMFDDDLQALARRNYQGGMPIELLSDAYLFEEHGNYFHTVDGRFAKIWRIQGTSGSILSNDCLLYTSPSPRDQRGSRMPSSA